MANRTGASAAKVRPVRPAQMPAKIDNSLIIADSSLHKLHKHSSTGSDAQVNVPSIRKPLTQTPLLDFAHRDVRSQHDMSESLRIDGRRFIRFFGDSAIINKFDHPTTGRPIDLVLDGI